MLIWKATHEREMTDVRAELADAREHSRAMGRIAAEARAETARIAAELTAIKTQRRTAAAKGRETQRQNRLAANGGQQ